MALLVIPHPEVVLLNVPSTDHSGAARFDRYLQSRIVAQKVSWLTDSDMWLRSCTVLKMTPDAPAVLQQGTRPSERRPCAPHPSATPRSSYSCCDHCAKQLEASGPPASQAHPVSESNLNFPASSEATFHGRHLRPVQHMPTSRHAVLYFVVVVRGGLSQVWSVVLVLVPGAAHPVTSATIPDMKIHP